MPFFDTELNRLANDTSSADLLVFLHTSAPTNASPANGRITTGGGLYESGATLDSTDITAAANGDVSNSASIPFGTVDENVGLPTHWSTYRNGSPHAFSTLPDDGAVNTGDTYTINAGSMQFNGEST